jgi:hypothetical protein
MSSQDFSTRILVDQTPEQVFNAVNNVRGWWSADIEGNTAKLNEIFRYRYQDIHACSIQLTELFPGKRVAWLVLDNYFKFTRDKKEWTNTKIIFDISREDGKTKLQFTHLGLVPAYECFDICSNAWMQYIGQSLRNLITTGKGQPNSAGNPGTEDEKRIASETASA